MSSQTIKLNLIPQGEMPVFYASQFDNGRLINIELYNGTDEYNLPSGYTAELHCRKADNNIVTLPTSQVTENLIKFSSTTQLTACYGNNLCEVSIMDSEDTVVGTLNFILEVEKDPLQGGITSTSEIHNLETQVEEITTEIIGENYYNKSEVDDLLADKADATDVYTKSQTDTLLSAKANSSDVYTKGQVDTALSAKADTTYVDSEVDDLETAIATKANAVDVYTKTETNSLLNGKLNNYQMVNTLPLGDVIAAKVHTAHDSEHGSYDKVSNVALDVYTKAQVDNIILDIMPVDTASGAIASFGTEIAAPLVNVSCNVVATGGNGTPDNPISINGYTEANITANGDVITIAFGQTVYGGVLDVTRGKLTITHKIVDLGDLDWTNENAELSGLCRTPQFTDCVWHTVMLCNNYKYNSSISYVNLQDGDIALTNAEVFPLLRIRNESFASYTATQIKNALVGTKVVYLSKTPFDIDLTPEVISAVVGTNNVYSDTNGDTTVQYKDSIQHYIDKHIGG